MVIGIVIINIFIGHALNFGLIALPTETFTPFLLSHLKIHPQCLYHHKSGRAYSKLVPYIVPRFHKNRLSVKHESIHIKYSTLHYAILLIFQYKF